MTILYLQGLYREWAQSSSLMSTHNWLQGGLMSSQSCLTNWLYLIVLTMGKNCVTALKAAHSTNSVNKTCYSQRW